MVTRKTCNVSVDTVLTCMIMETLLPNFKTYIAVVLSLTSLTVGEVAWQFPESTIVALPLHKTEMQCLK